jgi:hypothetical protein
MEPAIEDTQPRHAHHSFLSVIPQLVICDGKQKQRQTFFDVSKDRYYTESIPEMCNKFIYACSHGWLVLVDLNFEDCFLWNPISLEKIQLPLLPESFNYHFCVLSSPPCDPTCRIMFFRVCSSSFLFCQLGDLEFTEQELECGDNSKLLHATVVGKTIYCITTRMRIDGKNHLFIVEFTGSKVQFVELITLEPLWPDSLEITNQQAYLIDGCGELFMVRMMCTGVVREKVREFLVFQMDFSEKMWVKLNSIGERTIFLSWHWGICCSAAELGIKPNSIYYTRRNDRLLYVFDLENQSISRSLPCPIVSRFSTLDWIMM